MDPQTTKTLSALVELSQRIYVRATEAREKLDSMTPRDHYRKQWWHSRIAALVEVGNDVDRLKDEAQKADVEQPSPAVISSDWLEELEAALYHAQKARDYAPEQWRPVTQDLLACAENDLRAVLREERRHSSNEKLSDSRRE